MNSNLHLSIQASLSRVLSVVVASALLVASAPFFAFADESIVCAEGEVFSQEAEGCIPDPDIEDDEEVAPLVTEDEGSDEFCSIISDPLTQEGGEPAVVVSTLSDFWTAVIGDAFWIWGEDPVATPEETTTEVFTRTFTISGIPSDAELQIAVDDGYIAKLNGTLLGEDDGMDSVNFTLEGQDTLSIDTGLFAVGENTLTVEATNIAWGAGGENPAGVLFRLDMEGVSCGSDGDGGGEDEFGTIVIEKELEGSDENAFFSFSITPEEGEATILVVETEGRYGNNETDLPEGWYTVSEIVPEGWTLGSIVCNDEDSIEFAKLSEEEASQSETVYLDENEEITCVFVNVKDVVEEEDDGKKDGKTSNGPRSSSRGSVLGATTECGPLLTTYLGRSYANSADEVTKLQNFLNDTENANIPVTGLFDPATEQAVRVFQAKYWEDVLQPWFAFPQFGVLDSDDTTGIVYKTTKWKVNDLFCPGSEALPTLP